VTVPQSQISYTKNKEITVNKDGTYRTEFTLSSNSTFFWKIYKNGSAIGTERVVGNTTATFTEDFTFVAGDKVQLYTRTDNTNHSFEIINLKLTYDYWALSRYVATVNI
jgi:heme/copper-type cytochrome/quinol oxidase subunit 2